MSSIVTSLPFLVFSKHSTKLKSVASVVSFSVHFFQGLQTFNYNDGTTYHNSNRFVSQFSSQVSLFAIRETFKGKSCIPHVSFLAK